MNEVKHMGIEARGLSRKLWVIYLLMFVLPTAYLLFVVHQLVSGGLLQDGIAILTVALAVGLPVTLVLSIAALGLLSHSFRNMQSLVKTIESFVREFRTMQIPPPPAGDETRQASHYVLSLMGEFRRHMSAIDRYAEELHAANKQLEDVALVDTLTGLYNRKHALHTLDIEVQRVVRSGGRLSLLRAAIDGLEPVETAHGREKRDALIGQVAAAIAASVRRVDLVAHLGDGHFLVLLLETAAEGARATLDRMRSRIGGLQFRLADGGEALAVSVSLGVVTHRGESEGATEFMARADRELIVAQHLREGSAPRPATDAGA